MTEIAEQPKPTGILDTLEADTKAIFESRSAGPTAHNEPSLRPGGNRIPPASTPTPTIQSDSASGAGAVSTPPDTGGGEEDDETELAEAPKGHKQALDWVAATNARKSLKAEVKALKAELEAIRGKAVTNGQHPDLTALRKANEELENQLKAVAVERSPQFQEWYKNESNTILGAIKAQQFGKHADKVESVLQLPPGAARTAELDALVGELSPSQTAALNVALLDIDKLNFRKQDIITRQKDSWLANQREQEAKAQALAETRRKEWAAALESEIESAQAHVPIYQEKEGDKDWNENVKQQLELARHIYSGEDMSPSDLAKVALWAAAAPNFLKQNSALMEQNTKLQKELDKIKGVTPSPQAGESTNTPVPGDAVPGNMGMIDTVIQLGLKQGLLR